MTEPDHRKPALNLPLSRTLLAALLAVQVLACLVSGWARLRHSNLDYAREATGLPIPEFAFIDICDDSDFAIGYHLSAGDELRAAVLVQNQPRRDYWLQARMDDLVYQGCLPEAPDATRLIYAAGCNEGQAWIALLDPETDALWLEVQFPDMGGDLPPCPPGTTRP